MRRFVSFVPALVVLAVVVTVMLATPAALRSYDLAQLSARVQLAQNRLEDSGAFLDQLNQATRNVAEAVLPGVVHIQVMGSSARLSEDESPRRRGQRSSAAGWFYNEEGFIVTNGHVVQGANLIRVELIDGRIREASVIGVDPRTDIAVIKVDNVPGINPLRRASGQPIFVGDRVFAFGSPFGIKFSMSQGIVSGLGRSEAASLVGMSSGYTNFIQTDAAMNPGNSGGPLVDGYGRVIGMNTAIANNVEYSFGEGSPQGQSAGIGFAIPIESIEAIVSQLIEKQTVLRGYLGILLRNLRERGVDDGDINYDGAGVLVESISPGHPADKGGIEVGDIITKVAGQSCTNRDILRSIVSIRKPGDTVTMNIIRNGESIVKEVRLGAAYFVLDNRGQDDLRYIDGSESMTYTDILKRLEGPKGNDRID